MSYQDYLSDSSQHGSYQYVTVEQLVNDYIANMDPDSHIARVPRHRILYNILRGVRELYYDVVQEIRAIELELGDTLNVVLPPDFVNYVRISWVDENGQLHPMSLNNKSNIAVSYLQDSEGNLLFDNDGKVLTGTGTKADPSKQQDGKNYSFTPGYMPNVNLSQVHKNGSYRIDKATGIIQFDSNIKSKNIVLEYISDGLFSDGVTDIRIHKFAEQAVIDWAYWQLIRQRVSVPQNEKQSARKDYYNSHRTAKRRINTIRKDELIQAMSGSTMNIEPSN